MRIGRNWDEFFSEQCEIETQDWMKLRGKMRLRFSLQTPMVGA
jgi:hypothetical protein